MDPVLVAPGPQVSTPVEVQLRPGSGRWAGRRPSAVSRWRPTARRSRPGPVSPPARPRRPSAPRGAWQCRAIQAIRGSAVDGPASTRWKAPGGHQGAYPCHGGLGDRAGVAADGKHLVAGGEDVRGGQRRGLGGEEIGGALSGRGDLGQPHGVAGGAEEDLGEGGHGGRLEGGVEGAEGIGGDPGRGGHRHEDEGCDHQSGGDRPRGSPGSPPQAGHHDGDEGHCSEDHDRRLQSGGHGRPGPEPSSQTAVTAVTTTSPAASQAAGLRRRCHAPTQGGGHQDGHRRIEDRQVVGIEARGDAEQQPEDGQPSAEQHGRQDQRIGASAAPAAHEARRPGQHGARQQPPDVAVRTGRVSSRRAPAGGPGLVEDRKPEGAARVPGWARAGPRDRTRCSRRPARTPSRRAPVDVGTVVPAGTRLTAVIQLSDTRHRRSRGRRAGGPAAA